MQNTCVYTWYLNDIFIISLFVEVVDIDIIQTLKQSALFISLGIW